MTKKILYGGSNNEENSNQRSGSSSISRSRSGSGNATSATRQGTSSTRRRSAVHNTSQSLRITKTKTSTHGSEKETLDTFIKSVKTKNIVDIDENNFMLFFDGNNNVIQIPEELKSAGNICKRGKKELLGDTYYTDLLKDKIKKNIILDI